MASRREIALLKKLYGIENRAQALLKLDVLLGAIVTLTKQVADVEILVSAFPDKPSSRDAEIARLKAKLAQLNKEKEQSS